MVLDVVTWLSEDKDTLRKISQDVPLNSDVSQLIEDMFETMKKGRGIGLAAPQIGKNLNMFVVKYERYKQVFINPKIEPRGKDVLIREGCLSLPKLEVSVKRPEKVFVKYYDADWNYHEEEFRAIVSRIIQHEYDHLIGKLIID